MIQLQRRGYYRVDVAYNPYNPLTCKEEPIVVYYIPDGNSNNPAGIPKFGKPKKGEKKTAPSKPEKKGGKKTASDSAPAKSSSSADVMALFEKTKASGDKVAALKKAKAPKDDITAAVQILLANKAEYEKFAGTKYDANKPPVAQKAAPASSGSSNNHMALFNKTKESGDKVAALKKAKASKEEVTAAVQILLANKAEYEKVVGSKYDANKPPQSSNVSNSAAPSNDHMALFNKTKESGDKVAALKKAK